LASSALVRAFRGLPASAFGFLPFLIPRWRNANISDDIVMQVEFFGVPRERAGVAAVDVQAGTLGQLLSALATTLPSFAEFVAGDRLHPSFSANLNGNEFVSDPATPLGEDDCVLILSADAGG
jgi:molybdopterin converting factor small subunit